MVVDGCARGALVEGRWEKDLSALERNAPNDASQHVGRFIGHIKHGLSNARKGRLRSLASQRTVIADDGYVVGDSEA
jgi:hypothetical protein